MDAASTLDAVRSIAEDFASDRHDRQRRRELDRSDFDALAGAGFLQTGVLVEDGGLFASPAESARPIAEILRALAHGDSSVALVASMHPSVLAFWNATPTVPEPDRAAWGEQRHEFGAQAAAGHWFGTLTSEPGSGGDIAATRAAAVRTPAGSWAITGQKHFGSGSGITSFMITSAVAAGDERPDWFLLDVRPGEADMPRMKLIAPWDGHGMTATQSHGYELLDHPAVRSAWPGHLQDLSAAAGPLVSTFFLAVVLGIVETAIDTARAQLGRRDSLRAYEQVEWSNAEQDAWLVEQAYEGLLSGIEAGVSMGRTSLIAKMAAARLAEDCLRRVTRILGGGTFARHAPFGFWFEDVRALGFLRPPWGLAYDTIAAGAFDG